MADKADIKNTKTCPPKRTIEQTNKKNIYFSYICFCLFVFVRDTRFFSHTPTPSSICHSSVSGLLRYPHLQNPRRFTREWGAVSSRLAAGIRHPLPTCRTPTTNSGVLCPLCTKRKKATRSQGRQRPDGRKPTGQRRTPAGSPPWQRPGRQAHPSTDDPRRRPTGPAASAQPRRPTGSRSGPAPPADDPRRRTTTPARLDGRKPQQRQRPPRPAPHRASPPPGERPAPAPTPGSPQQGAEEAQPARQTRHGETTHPSARNAPDSPGRGADGRKPTQQEQGPGQRQHPGSYQATPRRTAAAEKTPVRKRLLLMRTKTARARPFSAIFVCRLSTKTQEKEAKNLVQTVGLTFTAKGAILVAQGEGRKRNEPHTPSRGASPDPDRPPERRNHRPAPRRASKPAPRQGKRPAP